MIFKMALDQRDLVITTGDIGGELVQECHNRQETGLMLSDFSKAFDKVSDEKLQLKLHHYDILGRVLL